MPASSKTTERSRPRSRLNKLDFPTFGRPTNANLGSRSSSSRTSGASGSSATMRSSRSPVARPCMPDTATGSPSPSAWNAAASDSSAAPSTLFATTSTGTLARRSRRASAASASVIPACASTMSRMRSASRIAVSAWTARELLDAGGILHVSSGVDQTEPFAAPDRFEFHPVARDAGHVVGDRLSPPEQTVGERRLPHVLTADHRDAWGCGPARSREQLRRQARHDIEGGQERPIDREVGGIDDDGVIGGDVGRGARVQGIAIGE